MTETPATTPAAAPVFPAGRYGRRREQRRRRPWLIAAALAVVLLGGLMVAYVEWRKYGDPAYDAQVISYTDITDTGIVVHFRVNVPADGTAACTVRARNRAGTTVGSEEVRVTGTPGGEPVTVDHRLATTERAFIGEVLRCRAHS
ncbi:DUF4307 domain-containing protein [Catenuloplanes atrovinosus]|uniref:DUF4307 domain-containing protein n=1 Tax=Catenuloplanes atrovinosus TaxID=137266 RepID=A0AAE3YU75_9ACTN|nr:DUF4307 domain-containing protein [Catenuloplanes atrovinosus]MDR7279277.1 hypothetical protein [Catenuloplanes atrovinosus]